MDPVTRHDAGAARVPAEDMLAQLHHRLHVWITEPPRDPSAAWLAAGERLLSSEERARHRRFVRAADRHLFLTARILVRTTLSRYLDVAPADWTFRRDEYGRPGISNRDAPSGLRFSLSHTMGMVALMVLGDGDGGVDVERFGRVASLPSVARAAFAPVEQDGLFALPPDQQETRFYELWTLKEAFVKATGRGLSLPLTDFWFPRPDERPIRLGCCDSLGVRPDAWTFTVWRPSAHHVVATACRAGCGPAREVDLLHPSVDWS